MNLHEKAERIKAVILDIDGVLTDGRIGYGCGSSEEIKFFHVRDGHGIKLASRAGIKMGILSGRTSAANRTRAKELGFDFVCEGCHDKREGFLKILSEQNLRGEECMYLGDDVVDIPPMKLAGIPIAVADGVRELDSVVLFRTKMSGGHGAVREALEWLLKEQGKWEKLMQRYLA